MDHVQCNTPKDIESEILPEESASPYQQEATECEDGDNIDKWEPIRVVGRRWKLVLVEEYLFEFGKGISDNHREWIRREGLNLSLLALALKFEENESRSHRNLDLDKGSSSTPRTSSTLSTPSRSPSPQPLQDDEESEYSQSSSDEAVSSFGSSASLEMRMELSELNPFFNHSQHSVKKPKRKVSRLKRTPLREFKKRLGSKDAIYLMPMRGHYFVGLYKAKKKTVYVSDSRNLTVKKDSQLWQRCKKTLRGNRRGIKIKPVPLIENQCEKFDLNDEFENDQDVVQAEHAILLARAYDRLNQERKAIPNELRVTFDKKLANLLVKSMNRRAGKLKKQREKKGVKNLQTCFFNSGSDVSISEVKRRENRISRAKQSLSFYLVNKIYKMRCQR